MVRARFRFRVGGKAFLTKEVESTPEDREGLRRSRVRVKVRARVGVRFGVRVRVQDHAYGFGGLVFRV
jgi:hypothetical protein